MKTANFFIPNDLFLPFSLRAAARYEVSHSCLSIQTLRGVRHSVNRATERQNCISVNGHPDSRASFGGLDGVLAIEQTFYIQPDSMI